MSGFASFRRSRGGEELIPLRCRAVAMPLAAERCPSPKDAVKTDAFVEDMAGSTEDTRFLLEWLLG